MRWLLLVQSTGLTARGFQEWWDMGSAAETQGVQSTGSAAVAHGLSYCTTHGIVPDRGSNLYPLPWRADSLPLSHQGNADDSLFKL